MIGAGIFVLTGQSARLAGDMFPVAFLVAAVVVAFSAYSYVKLSHAFPSSAGPAMFLREAYGPGTATGVLSLFMYVSMVLGESLVARTFGPYILQVVDLRPSSFWVPALGVALLAVAFMVNIAGNRAIQASEGALAVVKIGGLALFAIVAAVVRQLRQLHQRVTRNRDRHVRRVPGGGGAGDPRLQGVHRHHHHRRRDG